MKMAFCLILIIFIDFADVGVVLAKAADDRVHQCNRVDDREIDGSSPVTTVTYARRDIKKDGTVFSGDVEVVFINQSRAPDLVFHNAKSVVGRKAKWNIRQGSIMTQSDFVDESIRIKLDPILNSKLDELSIKTKISKEEAALTVLRKALIRP